jgi:hypothetical protein
MECIVVSSDRTDSDYDVWSGVGKIGAREPEENS